MFFRDNMWPYGRLQYILHQLNLDWLVKQVKQNTDDIEDIREHGGGGGVTPDISATATVDDSTGTPSVAVVKTGTDEAPNFAFNFHNLKGETGAAGRDGTDGRDGIDGRDGTDGVTPVISATASVNATTGTPSVTVTKSGTDAAPSFAFAFSNLKGAKGDTGDRGPAGDSSGDALPRYDVSNMSANISGTIANAYLNGRVPFYMLLANGGSSSVMKSSIIISSTSHPGVTVYCATNPVEVPAYDVVLVKFYWSGPDMRFDAVSSGGGGGGLTSLTFTVNSMKFRYYNSEYQPQQSISWAYHHQPISFVASSTINSSEQIGSIDDASLHSSGTALVFDPNNATTFITYYVIDSGMVLIMSSMPGNSRVTLF